SLRTLFLAPATGISPASLVPPVTRKLSSRDVGLALTGYTLGQEPPRTRDRRARAPRSLVSWLFTSHASTPAPATTAPPACPTSPAWRRTTPASWHTRTARRPTPPSAWRSRAPTSTSGWPRC